MPSSAFIKKLRPLNLTWHRGLGYFFSSLIIIYCISGLALNHKDDWDPDFIIYKKKVQLPATYTKDQVNDNVVAKFSKKMDEDKFKVLISPLATR